MALINPITFLREDYCIVCNSNRSIECYDVFNRPINFSRIIDIYNNKKIFNEQNIKDIYSMKCKKCNTSFTIDWFGNRAIPRPSTINHINEFMNIFKGE